ncbi:unnamed protein product [Adineta ricciae]|uniref:Uncharacterized protein n=1 Tax=Adineta ricciae TaxID=249248 RepID=A0A814YLK9_ADIRI|nr:unnamed protein product [Adineta ricciae]CAF1572279.1 unnamed protein product [Adineta ricciae]
MTSDNDIDISIGSKTCQGLLQQGDYLIKQVQDNITEEKQISKQVIDKSHEILNKAYRDYLQIKTRFLRKTNGLIRKALTKPHVRYHGIWLQAFNKEIKKLKQVIESILQELDSAQKESDRLKTKCRWLLGSTAVTSAICTTLVSGLILHFLPARICSFTINTETIAMVGLVALLTGRFSLAFTGSMIEISSIRVKNDQRTNEVQRLIMKCFSSFDIQKSGNTKEALNEACEQALNILQISESIWEKKETLEMLKNEGQQELNKLTQELADFQSKQ